MTARLSSSGAIHEQRRNLRSRQSLLMYRPSTPGERVETIDGPGEFTGTTDDSNETFEVELDEATAVNRIGVDTLIRRFHYEEITDPETVQRFPLNSDPETVWMEIHETTDLDADHKVHYVVGKHPWNTSERLILTDTEALKGAWHVKSKLHDGQ